MADIKTDDQTVEQLAQDVLNPDYLSPTRKTIAATLRALAAERDRLRDVVLRWQHYGCPDCGGDCASANPPVSMCIMQATRAALANCK